jgi:hypothetical protein
VDKSGRRRALFLNDGILEVAFGPAVLGWELVLEAVLLDPDCKVNRLDEDDAEEGGATALRQRMTLSAEGLASGLESRRCEPGNPLPPPNGYGDSSVPSLLYRGMAVRAAGSGVSKKYWPNSSGPPEIAVVGTVLPALSC